MIRATLLTHLEAEARRASRACDHTAMATIAGRILTEGGDRKAALFWARVAGQLAGRLSPAPVNPFADIDSGLSAKWEGQRRLSAEVANRQAQRSLALCHPTLGY